MKTLVGIVTFGNLIFTKEAIRSIKETTTNELDFFVVVGKPGDVETPKFLESMNIPFITHSINMGFPYSVNDLYDFAWVHNSYDNLIIAGNDIIAYPYAVDSLINLANSSDYECISALQYDVRKLVSDFPEAKKYFTSGNFVIRDFTYTPWTWFKGYSEEPKIADQQLYDIQNLCLYKKSVFDKVGYTDVAFYPAYFIDNDYANRMVRAGVKSCSLTNARFFHFWSRTIKQESGGSTTKYFDNNKKYYRQKWGGDVGKETKTPPLKIATRNGEEATVQHWRSRG